VVAARYGHADACDFLIDDGLFHPHVAAACGQHKVAVVGNV
jgi:hypothetical protein